MEYTSKKKPIAPPSLFDLYASIYISSGALLSPALSSAPHDSLPNIPSIPEGPYCHTLNVILDGLRDTSCSPPPVFMTMGGDPPQGLYNRLSDTLCTWVKTCVGKLNAVSSIQAHTPNVDRLLQLVRCISFLYAAVPTAEWMGDHSLYRELMSVLSIQTIDVYSRRVLQPLADKLSLELGNKRVGQQTLVHAMRSLIATWIEQYPGFAVESQKVSYSSSDFDRLIKKCAERWVCF